MTFTASATSSWQTTPANDDGGQKTVYLDRHNLNCGNGSAISNFKLQRPSSNQINYKYQCVKSSAIGANGAQSSTPWGATNGDYSTNYLDRLDVKCPTGQGLTQFGLKRDNDKLKYAFTCAPIQTICCKSATTAPSDASSKKKSVYLDRQFVGIDSTKDVLTAFRLHATYNPDRYYYTYSYCTLKDMDAQATLDTT